MDDALRVLTYLQTRGISPNVASYIGATTIREYVIGLEDKKATQEQLAQMRELVRREMEAGALGIRILLDLCAGLLCLDRRVDRDV